MIYKEQGAKGKEFGSTTKQVDKAQLEEAKRQARAIAMLLRKAA
jgi:hypothetical protein